MPARQINATQERIGKLKPSAQAPGDYSVREAALILNRDPSISTGQNRLLNLLRDWQLIDARDVPYATHERHVRLRTRSREHPRAGEEQPATQVRITAAGLRYLHGRLGGSAPVSALVSAA